jgi:hypothetical protein
MHGLQLDRMLPGRAFVFHASTSARDLLEPMSTLLPSFFIAVAVAGAAPKVLRSLQAGSLSNKASVAPIAGARLAALALPHCQETVP